MFRLLIFFAGLTVAVLVAGCGGSSWQPTLSAYSERNGILHVKGRGWSTCGTSVVVRLPPPWGEATATVTASGEFENVYAHPVVMPYRGNVLARQRVCGSKRVLADIARIEVGDARGLSTPNANEREGAPKSR